MDKHLRQESAWESPVLFSYRHDFRFMRSTLSRAETLLTTTEAGHFTNVAVVTYTTVPHLKFQMASGCHELGVRMSVNQPYDIASAHLLYHYAK